MAFTPRRLMRGASGAGGYQISRSLRFNTADSAYLNRTPASNGNRQTWTLSVWVKRGSLGAFNPIFSAGPVSPRASFLFQSDDKIQIRQVDSTDTEVIKLVTTQVFRDSSAWYHIVVAQDTTQATSSNRVKLYVNGTQVTAFDTATYPTQNKSDLAINASLEHNYGRYVNSPSDGYLSAYLTETNFIDGQQLTPSSFGETDASTGVWKPKAYSGSYGTNGFELNFSDNSNTTAATLGKDYSGNGNNFTPNNFSVTAGAGNDSLVDSPTSYGIDTGAGGEVRGNYCTLNPILQDSFWASPTRATLTNGNLDASAGSGVSRAAFATFEVPTNLKVYCELTINAIGGDTAPLIAASSRSVFECNYLKTGQKQLTGDVKSSYGASYTTGDIIGIAVDRANNQVTYYKNGTSQGVITTTFPDVIIYIGVFVESSASATFNFGQRPFAYTAPSGFKALCTQNLPTPTIGATTATQASKYFNTVLYTGNGTTQTISGVGFQPDFLWVKSRSNAYWNSLLDVVRGRAKTLFTNVTNAEFTSASDKEVTAFTSDGFSLGPDDNYSINSSGATFVAWNWKAGSSTVTNTSGTISSQVSASTTSGFSIATYTGNGTSGATVGHGLGATPSMIILKARSGSLYNWRVYHSGLTAGYNLFLNTDNGQTQMNIDGVGYISGVSSTTFTLTAGTSSSDAVNGSGITYVAYSFAPIAGYSAIGSYTANGFADGPFVYTGFRPAWILFKGAPAGTNWFLFDAKRSPNNIVINLLYPNAPNAENTAGSGYVDLTSNGFKVRTTSGDMNSSGTYTYIAFAENPFKYSLAR